MEEAFICAVCLEIFNEARRMPLVLACGHTFCRRCLHLLYSARQELRCPHCKAIDKRSPDSLSKNCLLFDLLNKRFMTTNPDYSDPWVCKLHPSERVSYISARQLYCSECLTTQDSDNMDLLEISAVIGRLQNFYKVYNSCSVEELEKRAQVCATLGEAMQAHILRTNQSLGLYCTQAVQQIKAKFSEHRERVSKAVADEQVQVENAGAVLKLLTECKDLHLPIEDVEARLSVPKRLEIISSLAKIDGIGNTHRVRKALGKGFEVQAQAEIPKDLVAVPTELADLPKLLVNGVHSVSSDLEAKVSRFPEPTQQWGVFPDKKQVEAVTFVCSEHVFISALGVGNSFTPGSPATITRLALLQGSSTNSPVLSEVTEVQLTYQQGQRKVEKVEFAQPVEILPELEYTIYLSYSAKGGVFRGGNTSRSKDSDDQHVKFNFKPTLYSGNAVKNGENADDGPIFDVYYKYSLHQEQQTFQLDLCQEFIETIAEANAESQTTESISVECSAPVELLGVCMGQPRDESASITVLAVEVRSEDTVKELQVVQESSEHIGNSLQLRLAEVLKLPAKARVTVRYCANGTVIRGVSLAETVTANQGIQVKTSYHTPGPFSLTGLLMRCPMKDPYSLGEIPDDFRQVVGAENKLTRFPFVSTDWALSTVSRPEVLTFSFSECVLLTSVGLGAPATVGDSMTIDSLQILASEGTSSRLIYSSTQPVTICRTSVPVSKVKLETPVKLSANTPYTIKVELRGDGYCFAGVAAQASIPHYNGVVFTSLKSKFSKQCDNQSAGPIIDLYYLKEEQSYDPETVEAMKMQLFPGLQSTLKSKPGEELKVSRFANTGVAWIINPGGHQVEAISFQVSRRIQLTAVGLATAFKAGASVQVTRLQIRSGPTTRGAIVYTHPALVSLSGKEPNFARVPLAQSVLLHPETWYTLRIKYEPGSSVIRGRSTTSSLTVGGTTFRFEGAKYEGADTENGRHNLDGPLKDFYFQLA